MRKIGLWGVVRNGVNDGYGYAGFKMVETLKNLDVEVLWQEEDTPIALSFIQPEYYGGCSHQYKIGYTPWESTELHEGWADKINEHCDEFWTTSYFCEQVFKDNGVVVPTRVVHHGLDSKEWTLSRRYRMPGEPFIFLHMGEPAARKGSQMVFDAFRETFAGEKDVYLVYKSSASWVECRWLDSEGSIVGPVDQWPNVQIIRGTLKQNQLDELYSRAHCLLYPSNGEGFGLIPFQGAATGLPTIAPKWGGIADFGDYLVGSIDYTVGPSENGYHLGDWCWPDFDSLCKEMRRVYEDYDSVSMTQYNWGEKLREDFSWGKIFTPVVEDLSRFF